MKITKSMVEQILKTLPVSYYCKKHIDVELTDDESSFDPISDTIRIGYNLISTALDKLTDDSKIEQYIRTLLYHEISHAILTPKRLRADKYINIVEDERIETLLANFYYNVDFKEFVVKANNYQGEKLIDFDNFFYQLVRYRVGPQELLVLLNELIEQFTYTNCLSDYYWYQRAIYEFVDKVKNYWNTFQQATQQNQVNNTSNTIDNISNDNTSDIIKLSQQIQSINNIIENAKQEQQTTILNENNAFTQFENITSTYQSADLQKSLDKLLATTKSITKQNASAINAYSGVFNPRSVVRDDYKYFVQQNRVGHVKMFTKTKLNLFIDCSGSFNKNDKAVNDLLHSLTKIEKSNPNFEYDLIHCEFGEKLAKKDKRFQKSCGGTYMTDKIIDIYKQVQNPVANNINIVLYDGYMFESGRRPTDKELKTKLSTFNNNKTILILDRHNEFVKQYITNARLIITDRYVDELQSNVLKALQILL